MQKLARPLFPGLIFFAIDVTPSLVHMLTEVVEVQTERIQGEVLSRNLIADPLGAIDEPYLLVGPIQLNAVRLATHHASRRLVVAARAANQAVLLVLIVVAHDFELFVLLIGSGLGRW